LGEDYINFYIAGESKNPRAEFEKILPEIKKIPSVLDVRETEDNVAVNFKGVGWINFLHPFMPQSLRDNIK